MSFMTRLMSVVDAEEIAMEESAFEFDSGQVAEASRRFPANRLAPATPRTGIDVGYLSATPGLEFGRHAWDEAGHL
jgi:hypothetical protein